MRRAALALLFVCAAQSAGAEVVAAKGGLLRMQDKMSGIVSDHDLAAGQTQALGRLAVRLDECRYPSDLPMGEAWAHLTITDPDVAAPLFKGWMVASSPALSALDHPRYDVWVLHCDVPEGAKTEESTSEGEGSGG